MKRENSIIATCLILLCLLSISSCKTQKMAEGGYFFEDVDKYFNQEHGVNVWVYRSFVPKENFKNGVRLTSLYPLDERMLRLTDLKKSSNKVLFSAVPERKPLYNFIAVKHNKRNVNLKGYKEVKYKEAKYFQKDFSFDGIDVRHAYIPYGNKQALSLVYYTLTVEHRDCPFCKFDYLANINALERKEDTTYFNTWQIYDCEPQNRKQVMIIPKTELLRDNKTLFLKLYDINGMNKSISFFKLFTKKDTDTIKLNLCPNLYVLEYLSANKKLLVRDTLLVK